MLVLQRRDWPDTSSFWSLWGIKRWSRFVLRPMRAIDDHHSFSQSLPSLRLTVFRNSVRSHNSYMTLNRQDKLTRNLFPAEEQGSSCTSARYGGVMSSYRSAFGATASNAWPDRDRVSAPGNANQPQPFVRQRTRRSVPRAAIHTVLRTNGMAETSGGGILVASWPSISSSMPRVLGAWQPRRAMRNGMLCLKSVETARPSTQQDQAEQQTAMDAPV